MLLCRAAAMLCVLRGSPDLSGERLRMTSLRRSVAAHNVVILRCPSEARASKDAALPCSCYVVRPSRLARLVGRAPQDDESEKKRCPPQRRHPEVPERSEGLEGCCPGVQLLCCASFEARPTCRASALRMTSLRRSVAPHNVVILRCPSEARASKDAALGCSCSAVRPSRLARLVGRVPQDDGA